MKHLLMQGLSKYYKRRCRIAGGIFHWANLMFTLDSFCSWPNQSECWSIACMEIPTSQPLGMVLSGMRENPKVIPLKIAPSHGGIWIQSNTWSSGLTRVSNPNGITVGSVAFVGLTVVTDRPRYSLRSNKLHLAHDVMRPKMFCLFLHLNMPSLQCFGTVGAAAGRASRP